MEQLLIFLLIAIGSAISGYIQNKKKREAEQAERSLGQPSGEPPVPQWPATARDWQEELRRMLQGEAPPAPPKLPAPPVVRKVVAPARVEEEISEGSVVLPSPLKESRTAYSRAANLQTHIEKRFRAVDDQTTTHARQQIVPKTGPSSHAIAHRWTSNPQALREAFIASLIFAPPVALAQPREEF